MGSSKSMWFPGGTRGSSWAHVGLAGILGLLVKQWLAP